MSTMIQLRKSISLDHKKQINKSVLVLDYHSQTTPRKRKTPSFSGYNKDGIKTIPSSEDSKPESEESKTDTSSSIDFSKHLTPVRLEKRKRSNRSLTTASEPSPPLVEVNGAKMDINTVMFERERDAKIEQLNRDFIEGLVYRQENNCEIRSHAIKMKYNYFYLLDTDHWDFNKAGKSVTRNIIRTVISRRNYQDLTEQNENRFRQ